MKINIKRIFFLENGGIPENWWKKLYKIEMFASKIFHKNKN